MGAPYPNNPKHFYQPQQPNQHSPMIHSLPWVPIQNLNSKIYDYVLKLPLPSSWFLVVGASERGNDPAVMCCTAAHTPRLGCSIYATLRTYVSW